MRWPSHPLVRTCLSARHVTATGDVLVFDYVAKSGKQRTQAVVDESVARLVKALLMRDDESDELFAYTDRGNWHDICRTGINAYLKQIIGDEVSAKDFRTWHATVLTVVGLAVSTSPSACQRAVRQVVNEVSQYVGNTATVGRSAYIDPRVVVLYIDGGAPSPRTTRYQRRVVRELVAALLGQGHDAGTRGGDQLVWLEGWLDKAFIEEALEGGHHVSPV